MSYIRRLFLLFAAAFVCAAAGAQMFDPVKWSNSVEYGNDGTAFLRIEAEIEEGWHLYSQYQKGTAIPLKFVFAENGSYADVSGDTLSESPAYTEHYDEFFKETEYYLDGKAVFVKTIKILSSESFTVQASVEGQACTDGTCVPVSSTVVFDVNGIDGAEISDGCGKTDSHGDDSLLWFFFVAFGGGVIALLTPCVFPVIPMTVSYFMKHGGLKQALFYGFSIIAIFMVFGLLFSVVFGQDTANFISTHWFPNVLFAVIFVLFAFSLLGYFEFSLPSGWVNKSAAGSSKAGYAGTFFMALTLVLASFSCTLPIAGTVILGAAAGGFLKPLIGMLGFSLAFALPFTAFALFPSALDKLPKSGSWMNSLKVTLAFVELAFALKFLSVPDQTYHWGILDREVYLALWIVLFGLLGLYFLGKIRFPHDDEMPVQKSLVRFVLAVCCLSFTVYMIPGMFGAPLNALSGWLPPMNTQDFKMQSSESVKSLGVLCTEPTFAGDLDMADGMQAYFDYDEALACARERNMPVLLDFSGHGCVNCRKVEQMVFSDAGVRDYISANFVLAALYVDDKVLELPEHLQTVEKDGRKIRLLGEKNTYIQNTEYGQNSQPCYIVVDPESGRQLAAPLFYETDPAKFMDFLKSAADKGVSD